MVIAAEALHGQMQVARRPVDQRQIHLAAVQPFHQMAAVAFDDAERNARIFVDGAPGEPRRNHAAHGRHQPEHHAPRGRAAGGLDLVAHLVDLPDDARRARQQQAAGVGQHHAAAVPGKQLGAQFMLEQLDLAAQRRLRHPQRVGGFAEAAELRHATERPELPDIHCLPIFEGRFIRYNNSA